MEKSFRKGFFSQFIPLGVIFFFLYNLHSFYEGLQDLLDEIFPEASDATIYFLAAFFLLLVFFLTMYIMEKTFGHILRITFLGLFDGFLGFFGSVFLGISFLALSIYVLKVNDLVLPKTYADHTFIYKHIESFIPKVVALLEKAFPDYVNFFKESNFSSSASSSSEAKS